MFIYPFSISPFFKCFLFSADEQEEAWHSGVQDRASSVVAIFFLRGMPKMEMSIRSQQQSHR